MESGGFVPWDALVPSTKSLIEKGAIITIGRLFTSYKVILYQ
jgi:dynein heavy chain